MTLPNEDEFLCYEVHGEADKYFNLISDTCTSVNALFSELPSDQRLNRMSEIGINARDTADQCTQIKISLEGCAGFVDGERITSIHNQNGVSVRPYVNRWRVSVPNCVPAQSLVMWIFCEQEPDMLRFSIARGTNLDPTSHGLLGMYTTAADTQGVYYISYTEQIIMSKSAISK